MNRPQSRSEIRKSAARAFTLRTRSAFVPVVLAIEIARPPDEGETPLSPTEVQHGLTHGFIARAERAKA